MLASAVDFQFRCEIPVEHIMMPSNHKPDEYVFCLDRSPGWRDPIISFLKDETLSKDKVEAQKLQHIAIRYILIRELLYKKNHISGCIMIPRWLPQARSQECDAAIHDDDCGNHAGRKSHP